MLARGAVTVNLIILLIDRFIVANNISYYISLRINCCKQLSDTLLQTTTPNNQPQPLIVVNNIYVYTKSLFLIEYKSRYPVYLYSPKYFSSASCLAAIASSMLSK